MPVRVLPLFAAALLVACLADAQTIDLSTCGVSQACTGTVTATPIVIPPPPPPNLVTFLSDLTPTAVLNGWGPWEKDRSNGENAAGDGRAMLLNGVAFPKGLGVHASSSLTFSLPAGCTRFEAIVGVDDETTAGSVIFELYAGTTRLYQSPLLRGADPGVIVSVALQGQSAVRLVVTDGGVDGITSDHADWAAARVTCTGLVAMALEFTPSTDPVTAYQLEVEDSGGALRLTHALGLPAIQADGMVRSDVTVPIASLTPGAYTASVRSVHGALIGPRSLPPAPFVRP